MRLHETADTAGVAIAATEGMAKNFVKALMLSMTVLLAAAPTAHAQISVGIQIGTPPPAPRAYRVPPRPGPEFVWVEGYWYPQRGHYVWHNGYWTQPPYAGAYWVEPYYQQGRYFPGYWEAGNRRMAHDHRWDQSDRRDWRRGERR